MIFARAAVYVFAALVCSACVYNTKILYFPNQRAPLYCRLLQGDAQPTRPQSHFFESVPLPNWPNAFALRNPVSNEAVIVANRATLISASARPVMESQFGRERLVAVRLMLQVSLSQEEDTVAQVREYLANLFPGMTISNSVSADVLLQIYSLWLASEYVRTPCDGVMQTSIPFEMLLPPDEGEKFLNDSSDDLQLAGMVLYTDALTGWKFHKSFTVTRQQFTVQQATHR